jgi:hypothetical protein
MCRRCIAAYFKSYTLTTFFLGWWGMLSFFMTPFILLNNIGRYLASLTLQEPSLPSIADFHLGFRSRPISVGEGNLQFKLIYGVVIGIALVAVVAYYNVALVQKYAPGLNAAWHGGEIRGEPDAEYAGQRMFGDIAAIDAQTKSQGWAGIRAEYLSRQPYLNDLKAQNARFQLAIAKERAAGNQDACEQLGIDMLAPAINDYVKATDSFYSLLSSAPRATPEAASQLKTVQDKQDDARTRMSNYFSQSKARGCRD